MLDPLILFLGLAGLWLGTDLLVGAASAIARHLGVSQLVIGVGVLAIGTDVPEVLVTVDAALRQSASENLSGLIVGTAVGSNLANISIVLGTAALATYLQLSRPALLRDGSAVLGSLLLLYLLAADSMLLRWEAVLLLAAYAVYMITLLRTEAPAAPDPASGERPLLLRSLHLLVGLVLVAVAADAVVGSATALAQRWGVAQSFIGLLLVGLGTSLPELAVSVGAVLKRAPGLAIGNIIGSNVFNALVLPGLAALIHPLAFSRRLLLFDLPALMLMSLLALVFLWRKKGLQRFEAATLIAAYLAYVSAKLGGL